MPLAVPIINNVFTTDTDKNKVGVTIEMSEDDGTALPGQGWAGQDAPSPAGSIRSDSDPESANPDAPSQPIQKRRRVTRACDECRRKKIKCDGKQPCTHCSVYSYDCTYDKPSNRRRNPAPQYIEALEGRLQRAETLLRKFMPDVDLADPNLDPSVQQEFHNREQARVRAAKLGQPSSSNQRPSESDSNDAQVQSMIDSAGQLDLDEKGGWDFHGVSSGTVFLKRMKDHFRGMLGPSAKVPTLPRHERPAGLTLDPPTPAGQSPFSSVSNYTELPRKEVARNLCYYSLSCATCLVRIVHLPSFYEKLDKIYERPLDSLNQEESHFLGLVYSVLALGCMYDSLDGENSEKMAYKDATEEGMKYYRSARALLQDLTECRDLTSLQALLFIILFLQATSNLSACYGFVGIALRSALRIGLHRHLQHDQIDTVEDETRRRVFYVIRQMDIYVSTLLGFPLMLNTDDIDQPFPTEVDDEFVTPQAILRPPPGSSSFFEAFNAHTRLMEILAKITKHVYPMKTHAQSVKSGKSTKSDKSTASYSISYSRIKEIEADLQTWYEKLPERWRPSPDGPIEVVRVRHLLRFVYAHVQLVLYRPFLHYVSPRLGQGSKIDELSYACAAAAISVSRNIVHIGLEIRKQRVLSGPYWFMLYTEFFAVLSLVFYAIENPEKPGSDEVLADARAGRKMIADLADKSLLADKVSGALKGLFDQLPEKLDVRNRQVSSKKRPAPSSGKAAPVPMLGNGRPSSVSSQRTEELARARSGGRSSGAFNTPNSGNSEARRQISESRFPDSFPASMPELMPIEMSSRATSGSPSTAGSSTHHQHSGYGIQHLNSHNPVQKLDTLMFPSEDPFAYPNQPMMELGFQPPVSMSGHNQNQQYFVPGSLDNIDSQLLGQPPPYMIQHPPGQPGLELTANMYDPAMFNIHMGHAQPHHQHMQQGQMYPQRRAQSRQQERQIDQMFMEQGLQADWGSFFGSGRGGFQGM